jgi:predicted extracellular nuclease
MKRIVYTACILLIIGSVAQAGMEITEWMYSGANGEFIEFTNVGSSNVDMTGWSFQDNDPADNGGLNTDLSAFGLITAGESVILTEVDDSAFRSDWGLASSVKIIGNNVNNLGRNDTINLYDASSVLVDTFSYGDQTYPGTIRTQNKSGNPNTPAALGEQTVTTNWVFASLGDQFGSHTSAGGDLANPGVYTVPEPATIVLILSGLIMTGIFARFRRN